MHGAVIYQCLTGSQVMNRPAKKYPLTVLRLLRHIAYNKPTQLLLMARHYPSSCSAKTVLNSTVIIDKCDTDQTKTAVPVVNVYILCG